MFLFLTFTLGVLLGMELHQKSRNVAALLKLVLEQEEG